jgi:hypothetical protein
MHDCIENLKAKRSFEIHFRMLVLVQESGRIYMKEQAVVVFCTAHKMRTLPAPRWVVWRATPVGGPALAKGGNNLGENRPRGPHGSFRWRRSIHACPPRLDGVYCVCMRSLPAVVSGLWRHFGISGEVGGAGRRAVPSARQRALAVCEGA